MKVVIQRVKKAKVEVENKIVVRLTRDFSTSWNNASRL